MKLIATFTLITTLFHVGVLFAQPTTRVIDDFESSELFNRWKLNGTGKITRQSEVVKQGSFAMRFDFPLGLVNGKRIYQIANLHLDKEDWREFNRITFWVYFDAPDRRHVSLGTVLHNANEPPEGITEEQKRQTRFQTSCHSVVVPPGKWVKIEWDIPEWRRDKVTLLQIAKGTEGFLPGQSDQVIGYFDDLRLERVPTPKWMGWDTPPGLVSFVHTGYFPWAEKLAVFPDQIGESMFSVVDDRTGLAHFRGRLRPTPICDSRPLVADFTEMQSLGIFRIECGSVKSEPFCIDNNVLAAPTQKVLHFIWCQRCGIEIPFVHGKCHLDNCRPALLRARSWNREEKEALLKQMGDHVDLTGGWHDAGIVDQYTPNTAWITYALCRLAETGTIKWDRNGDERDDILDEAAWGAEWLLKLLMPDGDLINSSPGDAWWTDNQIGTPDDRRCDVCGTYPQYHFAVLAAQGRVARAFSKSRPELVRKSLAHAQKTWDFVMTKRWRDRTTSTLDTFAPCAIAGIELWLATGEERYKDVATEMLNLMADCQETEGELIGFFYTSPRHERIFRHRMGLGEVIYAFALGCETMINHPDRNRWMEVLWRYVQRYVRTVNGYNAPYRILPYGLYDADEAPLLFGAEGWWVTPWDQRAFALFPRADEYNIQIGTRKLCRIRSATSGQHRFWLTEAVGLAAAARVLQDRQALTQALRHVNWLLGLNPFSMTMLWSEGYRSPTPYCPMPGLMVGSIGLGIGSLDNNRPYFSPQIYYNQREVWTIAGGMFVWAVAEIERAKKIGQRKQEFP